MGFGIGGDGAFSLVTGRDAIGYKPPTPYVLSMLSFRLS